MTPGGPLLLAVEDGPRNPVPILRVSASVLPRDRAAALDAGCDGFLARPVWVKPQVDEVRRLLGQGSPLPRELARAHDQ